MNANGSYVSRITKCLQSSDDSNNDKFWVDSIVYFHYAKFLSFLMYVWHSRAMTARCSSCTYHILTLTNVFLYTETRERQHQTNSTYYQN